MTGIGFVSPAMTVTAVTTKKAELLVIERFY
jgi:hypothetical protein